MKYIASCSFGKDSIAAILSRLAQGEPLDGAVYCRIMFDDAISAELPEHEEWIHETAIPVLKTRYGVETTIIQANNTYTRQFNTKYQKGKWAGYCYGWPFLKGPWCNDRLKIAPIKKWQTSIGGCISIIGIAADEPKRIKDKESAVYPLVEHGITEAQAFNICQKAGLLSPAYSKGRQRLGCWFCHNQRIGEFRRLYFEYPQLWERLMELDTISHRTFTPRYSVHDLADRFAREGSQFSLFT